MKVFLPGKGKQSFLLDCLFDCAGFYFIGLWYLVARSCDDLLFWLFARVCVCVKVAMTWPEVWHEGLEEASCMYFRDGNVEGMLDRLQVQ